ncbi:hypothetical protein O5706_29220 [Escherichia coli]|nr:hypothetical protein [Escherichia coli]
MGAKACYLKLIAQPKQEKSYLMLNYLMPRH